ncbi:DUF3558 family protein [Actinophytocola sp.]|uniref:DUF3558 family protein n=1 Tax=Actinophytocola sp. TaxID=1872138 RepID=UPI002D7E791F|nr:DUF3558 family protein [Actinophytocola sp.]HET9142033.1 DUF3558 family protein [Actinophytocola sp.]
MAVSAAVTSCATSTAGQPLPEGDVGGTSTSRPSANPSSRPTTRPQTGGSPLADLDPCALLTASAKATLGITAAGERRKILDTRLCQWKVRGPKDTYILGVGLLDKAGIDDIPSGVPIEQLPNIGDHQAVRSKEAGGTTPCAVILGVTNSSRVELQATAGTDVDKACELAMDMAKLVEPELP